MYDVGEVQPHDDSICEDEWTDEDEYGVSCIEKVVDSKKTDTSL